MGKTSCKKFSPHPFQELSNSNSQNKFVSLLTDSRRERTARFCYRERLSTTKTPAAKRVVKHQAGAPRRSPTYGCLFIS